MSSHLAGWKLFIYLQIITSPIGFNIALTNVNARLKQRCTNFVQRCFELV